MLDSPSLERNMYGTTKFGFGTVCVDILKKYYTNTNLFHLLLLSKHGPIVSTSNPTSKFDTHIELRIVSSA